MPKVSVEIPPELLDDLDEHVSDEGKFVNRSDAIRVSIRKHSICLMRSMHDTGGLKQTKLNRTSRNQLHRRDMPYGPSENLYAVLANR